MARKYKFFKTFIQKNRGRCDSNIQDNDKINSCSVVCAQNHRFDINTLDLKNGKWCNECLEIQQRNKYLERDRQLINRLKSSGRDLIKVLGQVDSTLLTNYRKDLNHYNKNIKQMCTQSQIDEIVNIENQVNAIYFSNPTNLILMMILEKLSDIEGRIDNVETSINNIELSVNNSYDSGYE